MPEAYDKLFGIIFDLDDTLIATSHIYYKLFTKMQLEVYNTCTPKFITPQEILDVFAALNKMQDEERVDLQDMFSLDCTKDATPYPQILVQTYVECCLRAGVMPDKSTAYRIHRETNASLMRVGNYPFVPNATRLLNQLINRGNVRMFLLTAGDTRLQRPKIESRLTFKHFNSVKIIPFCEIHDKAKYIKQWQKEYEEITHWVMVGDSIPVDINPALATGCIAVHVTENQAHMARGELVAAPNLLDNYVKLNDMGEVYDFLVKGILNVKSQVSFKERERSIQGS